MRDLVLFSTSFEARHCESISGCSERHETAFVSSGVFGPAFRNNSAVCFMRPLRSRCSRTEIKKLSQQSVSYSSKRRRSGCTELPLMTQSVHVPNIEILALTEAWVAVNKPPGMLVHHTKLYHSIPNEHYLVDVVSQLVSTRRGFPVAVKPVQRLDRPTSGVMVFALGDADNAARLQATLQSADTEKLYWALVWGADMPEQWVNDHPLTDLTGKKRKQRSARTEINQLARMNVSDMSIISARIRTGRRHQVRRHLSYSHHPILGDTSYGKGVLNRKAREHLGVSRCCLHAWSLTFKDPLLHELVRLAVPVPLDLQDVVGRIPDFACAHNESFWNPS